MPPVAFCGGCAELAPTAFAPLRYNASDMKATGLQFTLNFDATKLTLDGWTCEVPGAPYDACEGYPEFNIPPKLSTGHAITGTEKAPGKMLVVFFSSEGKHITDAHYDASGQLVGSATVADALFTIQPGGSASALDSR